MPSKRRKTQYLYLDSKFLDNFYVHLFGPKACVAWARLAAKWTASDLLQLKTCFPSTRNAMFWKKLASRADETPSYELSFAGHELGCQK